MVLHRGRVVQQGPPAQIYQQPADEYTAALFGDYNLVRGADRLALAPATGSEAGALLVRPEQFRLGPAAAGGPVGTVRAVRFFGSYYELEVQLPETVVRVRAGEAAFAVGEAVGVAVATGGGWVIPE